MRLRRKRLKTITTQKALADSAAYYLQERNRYREALIDIVSRHQPDTWPDHPACEIAAKALRLAPYGEARWINKAADA